MFLRKGRFWIVVFVLAALLILVGAKAGEFLVQDNREKSDVIVVLAGDHTTSRYNKGLELLRAGYGKVMLVNASADYLYFGHPPSEYAARYIKETAGPDVERVKVCPVWDNSTKNEAAWVVECLKKVGARSALIVTSDHHTRRALAIFRRSELGVRWTVAAAYNPKEFGTRWWTNREWAKMMLTEGERLFWWYVVDQWNQPQRHSINIQSP